MADKPASQTAAKNIETKQAETVPDSWPGAFGLLKYSTAAVMVNLLVMIILFLLSGAGGSYPPPGENPDSAIVVLTILGMLISIWATVALYKTELAGVRKTKVEFFNVLRESLSSLLGMIVLFILSGVILILSFLALIVPFFFVLPRIVLAPYFLVDKQMGPIESLKASWAISKGNSAKVWGIFGANIVFVLPVLTLIGIPVTIYLLFMYSAALAVLYIYLQKQPASAKS